jgi:MFS transporter, DHA1 family, tetracycline resistance protein
VSRLLILFFLYEFAFLVYPAVWAFFAKERFGWTPGLVGASLAAFGVGVAIVQGGLIRVVLRRLGERGTILYGICFNLMAFVVLAVITDGWFALAFIPVTAFGAVVTPALMARMSKLARDDQQGELQGVIASAKSVAAIFAPFVMTQTFAAFADPSGIYAPGAPFVLSAMLMVLCLAVFLGAREPLAKAT